MGGRTRRQFVVGSTVIALTALAGCADSANGGDGMDGDGTPTPTDEGETATPTDGGATATPTGGSADPEQQVTTYLDKSPAAGNFDGTIVDKTGSDTVVVKVGAEGNGGALAFSPPAITISTGTTISWEWTGKGGKHNVVSTGQSDVEFRSASPKNTGEYTNSFDSTGVGLYFCDPHRTLGMKGGFIVV